MAFRPVEPRLRSRSYETDSGCIIWYGAVNNKGYGLLWVYGKLTLAHRAAYEIAKGPIPPDTELDHLCRTRQCINPDHLEAVSHKVNLKRGLWPNASKTHCPRGHPYSGDNLFINNHGRRECRSCKREGSKINARRYRKNARAQQSP